MYCTCIPDMREHGPRVSSRSKRPVYQAVDTSLRALRVLPGVYLPRWSRGHPWCRPDEDRSVYAVVALGNSFRDVVHGRSDDAAAIGKDLHSKTSSDPADLEEASANARATETRFSE